VAAMDEGAQVVNLSLAGPADPLLSALVETGIKRGIVYVGSVSPSPLPGLSGFPGGTAGMLVVDSSEAHTALEHALRAPGNEILTLTPGGHFDFASGSSLATAHVTGTVALLLAQDAKLKPEALMGVLSRTSTQDSINACAAVATLKNQTGCASAPTAQKKLRPSSPPRARSACDRAPPRTASCPGSCVRSSRGPVARSHRWALKRRSLHREHGIPLRTPAW